MYKIAKFAPLKLRRLMFKSIIDGLGGKLECFICGGAPLEDNVAEFFERIGIPIKPHHHDSSVNLDSIKQTLWITLFSDKYKGRCFIRHSFTFFKKKQLIIVKRDSINAVILSHHKDVAASYISIKHTPVFIEQNASDTIDLKIFNWKNLPGIFDV